MYVVPKIL